MSAGSRRWLVDASIDGASGWLLHGLRARRQDVVIADDIAATSRSAHHDVVVCAGDVGDPLCTSALVRQVALVAPSAHTLVLQGPDHPVLAAAVMRHGGQPLVLVGGGRSPAASHDRKQMIDRLLGEVDGEGPVVGARLARDALAAAVEGQHVDAFVIMARIARRSAPIVAATALADATSVLLDHLRLRSRYPIRADFVISRLAAGAEVDIDACHDMLQWAGLRGISLEFDLGRLVERHGATGVLFGAFHAAHAVIRFSAERWWRSPRSVFDGLVQEPASV